ncbi:MAG: glutamyl-tRNA reductase [Ignavibacteria bacterium]|nr:glutamyl-tRNA reductase [Ignavibacteria bacterium]MBI3765611.1 glutamyl-tRNA reductase [Ignavibacteriales bacterium]
MNIHCLGINHRTAPIEIREKLWFSISEIQTMLPTLRDKYFHEVVLVSTCNRTEVYYVQRHELTNGKPVWRLLAKHKQSEETVGEHHFCLTSGIETAQHLFAVASGIDSMVLGDVQILSQMKEAFSAAQDSHTTGILMNRLFNTAFHVAKRARTETEIGEGAVSISYAAAELASKIFEDLSKRTALLIGAGETGKLTAKHLASRNLGTMLMANRTRQRAEELVAHLGGRVIDFDKILAELPHVDIIISSVEANAHILSAHDIRQVMKLRGNKPLFIIDIGVPRNVDPSANIIDNVFLHDIDALNHIVDHNLTSRRAQVPKIEKIISEELQHFQLWYDSLEVTPTIQQLRDQFEAIRQAEVEKHLHHFATDKREEIEMLTKRIVNKILHAPMVNLKNGTTEHTDEESRTRISVIRHIFGLDKRTHQ